MVNSQNLTSDTQNTLCFWPASKYTANTQSNTQWWWSLADQGVTCASCQVLIQNYPEAQYLSSRFGCLVTCDRLPRSNLPPKHVLYTRRSKTHKKRQKFLRLRRADRSCRSRCSVYPGIGEANTQNTLCFQPDSKYTKYRLTI